MYYTYNLLLITNTVLCVFLEILLDRLSFIASRRGRNLSGSVSGMGYFCTDPDPSKNKNTDQNSDADKLKYFQFFQFEIGGRNMLNFERKLHFSRFSTTLNDIIGRNMLNFERRSHVVFNHIK